MFGQEKTMSLEHEILKENHEALMKDYECLQESFKHTEQTYEAIKLHLQKQAKEFEESNRRLREECARERSEKEEIKKMFEEIRKVRDSAQDAIVEKLVKQKKELLLARMKDEEELVKIENKYVDLAEKFVVVEAECAYLNSLYDAEVAASVNQSAVVSGNEETETDNLVGQGENEVNHNANNAGKDAIMLTDDSDAEHDKPPTPRKSNISSPQPVDTSKEEQGRNRENSPKENRASGETVIPRPISNSPPITPSSSASLSSSSSSDDYEVIVKLPHNWPEWATPKGPSSGSNKS
ncbi:hypothetical protein CARUB_v10001601mg [Capsella rubella]|uniref:Uncharacterized protein n=1 Tax=Capsella rubella TaxID=81985 RepID=R0FGZ1_9BRAS|nr:uncharacterized protein LOC17882382 [Capsella rubella]XP_023637161.1 uncharacterized protein LOC17882382 [Capsella rubella]EOA21251.1 hypothetical protein CARUB_v10001601mg [Capsella rubella]